MKEKYDTAFYFTSTPRFMKQQCSKKVAKGETA